MGRMEGRIAIVGLPLSVGLGSLEWGGSNRSADNLFTVSFTAAVIC